MRISLLDGETKTATVDLCSEHTAPMLEAMKSKPVGARKKRTVTTRKAVTAKKRAKR